MSRLTVPALLALCLIGCGITRPPEYPFVEGSVWVITALDGEALVGDPMLLLFSIPNTRVSLDSGCGATSGQVEASSDGDAITFRDLGAPHGRMICADDRMALFERVTQALMTVDRWQGTSDSAELVGASTLTIVLRDIQE